MGINAQLTDELGNVESEILDPLDRLNAWLGALPDLQSTTCVQYIDPYGDTVFNRMKMEPFLAEWVAVENLASTLDDKGQCAAIRALAIRCRDSAHLYLKFIGD